MNPGINIFILTLWTLLASISYAQPTSSNPTVKNAAQVKDVKFASNFPLLKNNPLFCVYPPPPVHMPGPPVHQTPPVSAPPSPYTKPEHAVWCVAKPTVPDSAIQHALDYACAWGADCALIQVNGFCYLPNTVLAHASYAFNSYWQRTKRAGGTCDFGGLAMLVTVDPSYDKCHFIYS